MKSKLKNLIHKFLGNNFQKIENYFYFLPQAIFWNLYYQFPSRKLKIIGVTGTDGKTTTSNMIYHILKHENIKVGMVSTISAKIGSEDLDTGFHVTSPNPKDIQKYLKMMIDKGIEYVVLETTSHALDQFRYWGIKFDYAVYTNITQDHFDYHGNYENYLNAKLKLIDNLKENGMVIANYDDKSFIHIQKRILKKFGPNKLVVDKLRIYGRNREFDEVFPDSTNPIRPYQGIVFNDFEVVSNYSGLVFKIMGIIGYPTTKDINGREQAGYENFSNQIDVKLPMIGNYNIYNTLAALTAVGCVKESLGEKTLKEIGIYKNNPNFKILELNLNSEVTSLSTFTSLSGRMEIMQKGDDTKPMIIVDFAHTPNALEKALSTLRDLIHTEPLPHSASSQGKESNRKLIVVFGCAGLRDKSKRSMMGEVAAKFADTIILVPEDPRTENLKEINDQISEGIKAEKLKMQRGIEVCRFDEPVVESRVNGIKQAIAIAKPQDIIVICGKGHEQSLCFRTTEYPYSDQEIVRKLLK